MIAGAAALGLAAGAMQLLPSAGAEGIVVSQVASSTDAGAVDVNRDGAADYSAYGVTNAALSVGEQPRDGNDLRLFLPFDVSATALDAVKNGGKANASMRVWRVDHLTTQKLVVDAYVNGTSAQRSDYNRPATRVVTITPVKGRLALDLTGLVRSMTGAGTLTLRFSLDQLAPKDRKRTQVNIATSEARRAEDRPVLTASSAAAGAPSPAPIPPAPNPPAPVPPAPNPPAPIPPAPNAPAPNPPAQNSAQPPGAVTGGASWNRIFTEEFDGDLSQWNVQHNSTFGDGNNEDQTYMSANTTVSNGTLKLQGKPDNTSGMVTTRNQGGPQKFKFKQGYIEARYRVPQGSSYWPAFWLVGAQGSPSWPQYLEIDVSEIYGPQVGVTESNCHFGTSSNITACGARKASIPDPYGWHTFGLNWTSTSLEWYVDGQLVRTYTNGSAAFLAGLNTEHSPILNLAIGGDVLSEWYDWDGSPSPAGNMEVDYVRAWQR